MLATFLRCWHTKRYTMVKCLKRLQEIQTCLQHISSPTSICYDLLLFRLLICQEDNPEEPEDVPGVSSSSGASFKFDCLKTFFGRFTYVVIYVISSIVVVTKSESDLKDGIGESDWSFGSTSSTVQTETGRSSVGTSSML